VPPAAAQPAAALRARATPARRGPDPNPAPGPPAVLDTRSEDDEDDEESGEEEELLEGSGCAGAPQQGARLRLQARRARAGSDSDGSGSDQDHNSALGQPVAQQSQQRRAAWQAAAAADTGCSGLPSLPALCSNPKGPVIIVKSRSSGDLGAGAGPILRQIGALPSGAQVSGPIQMAPVPTSALTGALKLQPVTLRPVMLVPAKGAATYAAGSPSTAGSSQERVQSAFAEQLRASADKAERAAEQQEQQQRHGGSSRQRQSKLSAKQAAKREAEQLQGSPKGAKRARGQGPARIAAAPAGHCCSQCGTQTTPVWRAGPQGPKTLCNACGVRYMKTAKKK
jgi:hypothetical protein